MIKISIFKNQPRYYGRGKRKKKKSAYEWILIDEMNKLGTSADDTKKYNALKKKREELFKSTIPYLEKAVELDPSNQDVSKTLLNVYSALEMTAEYKALKAKM